MNGSNLKVNYIWFERLSYLQGLEHQERYRQSVLNDPSQIFIMGLEHPSVITLGKRGDSKLDLSLPHGPSQIDIQKTDRGGQATLHSPGQLVIYPIVSLATLGLGVRDFVLTLLRTTQMSLHNLGIETFEKNQSALYTANGKIAFFGLKVSHNITSHGLAINVCNDLSLFSMIRSCGIANESFDQTSNYCNATPRQLFQIWAKEQTQNFSELEHLTIEAQEV